MENSRTTCPKSPNSLVLYTLTLNLTFKVLLFQDMAGRSCLCPRRPTLP